MKFKVGDKARVLEAQYSFEKVGDIITVTDVEDTYVMGIHQDNHGWSWDIERIEKIAEPAPLNLDEIIGDLRKENAKLNKQIKLLHTMLQGRGYEALAIESALELLD